MNLKSKIAVALKSGASTEVEIYWDRQDPNNEGPAFRERTGDTDQRESGPLDFAGWAHISGRKVQAAETADYTVHRYFTGDDNTYTGPDEKGIYPRLS